MTVRQYIPDSIPAKDRKYFQDPLPTPEGAEMSVVGSLLIDPVNSTIILQRLGFKRGHFGSEQYRQIFIAAVKCIKRDGTVDLITLREKISQKQLAMAERCVECVPTANNIRLYGKLVMEAWERRELMKLATRIAFRLHEGGNPQTIRKGMQEWLSKQSENTGESNTQNGHSRLQKSTTP